VTIDERSGAYRRMLRWYPAEWRAQHEAAVVGILLDQADERGETKPSAADRFTLAIGGLRRRFGGRQGRQGAVITPLALATAFLVYYAAVITWSPGVQYDGAIGPFSNPTIIVAALFAVALASALAGRSAAARAVALIAAGAAIGIAVLAAILDWLGPSLPTAVPIAGFGVIAALPWRGALPTVISVGSLLALFAFILVGQIAAASVPLRGFEAAVALAQVAVLIAVAVIVAFAARRAARLEVQAR
jgi:hypothetical protein